MRVAAVQASPVFLDAGATTAKTVRLLEEAAANGAELVVLPEGFIPGYPAWLEGGGAEWLNPDQRAAYAQYLGQSISADGPELEQVAEACSRLGVFAYVGFAERSASGGTVYCSLAAIHPSAGVASVHRKLMGTHFERLVWGQGDGHGLVVHEWRGARVGGLNCWENWMPLARYSLYAQGEQIHALVWPGVTMLSADITRFVAMEGRMFAVSAGGVLRSEDVPDSFALKPAIFRRGEVALDGGSMIVAPDGTVLASADPGEETILYADCDLSRVRMERQYFDPAGHYGRPDVFQLTVSRRRLEPIDSGATDQL